MDEALFNIYSNAEYHVSINKKIFKLKPQIENLELNNLLTKKRVLYWAIITSFNPKSKIQPDKKNIQTFAQLKKDLQNYQFYLGLNPSTQHWPEEQTLFILNIDKKAAVLLAKKYNQNAILYGTINSLPEVIWCD